ncbi:hypothetical protein [Pseudonocardia broussonetiae]|uniref:Uncharacterized protein n=1 Tax=Pseudonocardia broussonetiae TaxID=2736640 RepID=A0A6M6JG07_9PSEU|nr:hypothetical protein [Pseudonocardia broussonetiae]QJY46938.1 hypothetical protein HOP40_14860 [Pseudonocardia broussonetiae]
MTTADVAEIVVIVRADGEDPGYGGYLAYLVDEDGSTPIRIFQGTAEIPPGCPTVTDSDGVTIMAHSHARCPVVVQARRLFAP